MNIDRPEAPGPGMRYPALSRFRATVQGAFAPLFRNGVPAVHSSKQSPADGGVGVGIAAAPYGIHNAVFKICRMDKLPQGILESHKHPALFGHEIGRNLMFGLFHSGTQRGVRLDPVQPSRYNSGPLPP